MVCRTLGRLVASTPSGLIGKLRNVGSWFLAFRQACFQEHEPINSQLIHNVILIIWNSRFNIGR